MDTIVELASFLRPDSKPELKSATLEHLAGLTVTRDGREVFTRYPPLLESLSDIVRRLEIPYARDALTCFINLAAEKSSTEELLSANVLNVLLESLSACSDSICKEKLCMTLSNLTRTETGSEAFVQLLRTKGDNCLSDIVDIFCESQNRGSRELDYIATVFGNVSQVADGRDLMMDRSKAILKRLLPLLECSASAICRRSIACLVKNCCFDVQHQEWILSDDIDILSRLLLPLAGPEELEEEEMEKLPIDLQYLGDDKTREPEADIRVMLLEAIMQLCATQHHRQYVKSKNTYVIIRELHKQESDASVSRMCENLIYILIADEPEEGMGNLQDVSIPPNISAQLQQQDSDP